MKKILYFALLCCAVVLSSCEKDPIGGTATQALAGQWYVQIDAMADGEVWAEDVYEAGKVLMLTYNTNANDADKIYLNDYGFWPAIVQIPCSLSDTTFGFADATGSAVSEAYAETEDGDMVLYDIDVHVWGGKIMKNAGHYPNGSPADSIVFYINYGDDTNPTTYGFDCYRVSGVRYSGLVEND